MFDYQSIKSDFNKQGFVIIPKLFDEERVDKLTTICERILSQWRKESHNSQKKASKKNLDIFKKTHYFSNYSSQLNFILDTIADEQILSILDSICDRKLLFEGILYFFNPKELSWQGDWHRDGQIIAPDDTTEKSRIFNSSFIRVHIAFIHDNYLEFVVGSHVRWDNPQELEIRKGLNGKSTKSNKMPSVTKINLNPGDAVFFDGYGIHRGNYLANQPRKTLAILYGSPVDWFTPSPASFLEPKILDLSLQKREFFQKLIKINENK